MLLLCAAAFAQDAADLLGRLAGDEAARAGALQRLRELGPAAFPDVVKGLDHDDVAVRRGAAEVLAFYSRSMETIEPHGKALALALKNDDDQAVRRGVGEALLKAGPESLKWLERAFACKYADAREAAGRAVGRIGPKGHPTLRKNLASRSVRRRSAALAGIAETGAVELVPAVLPLLKDRDPRIRVWAATALGGLPQPDRVVPALLGALRDEPAVASAAALALAPFAKDRMPEILAVVPDTGDTLDALLEGLPADALPAWERALPAAGARLRARLLRTLPAALRGRLSPEAQGVVLALAGANDVETRRLVADYLVAGHVAEPREVLRRCAKDPDDLVRAKALQGLTDEPDLLTAALEDPAPRVRAEAAFGLWRRDRTFDVLPHLTSGLLAGVPEAARRIGQLGALGAPAIGGLAAAVSEDNPELAVEAVRALGHVLESGGDPFTGRAARFAAFSGLQRRACEKALGWLAAHQADDGRWEGDRLEGAPQYDVGVTGLALLAFTSVGIPPAHLETVQRGAAWLKSQQRDRLIGWGLHFTAGIQHAIATTALAEVAATLPGYDEAVRDAVLYITAARNPDMAWRYRPRSGKNDTFVTAWMVTALRTAEGAGFEVDREAYAGAMKWIDKMTDPNFGQVGYNYPGGIVARFRPDGGGTGPPPGAPIRLIGQKETPAFRSLRTRWAAKYRAWLERNGPMGEDFSQATTAAGVWVRGLVTRRWRDTELLSRKGYDLIEERRPQWKPADGHVDLCYWHWGALVAAQAPEFTRRWRDELVGAIVDHQNADGSWDPVGVWGREGGRVFSTATCVLALLAPASQPSHALSRNAWRARHAVGFDTLAYAQGIDDERIRAAAKEFAHLVR